MSPRHQIRSTPSSSIAASTASRAGRLPWMSEMTAMRMENGGNVWVVDRGRTRLPVALVAVAAVAEGAVLLLRPRGGVIDPAPVRARSYFSGPELARARAFRRPQLAGAAAGAGLSVALTAAPLPLAAIARQRSIDAGLTTQSWRGWAGDLAKSAAVGTLFAGAGAALLLALMRRLPRGWWLPGSVAAVGVSAAFL